MYLKEVAALFSVDPIKSTLDAAIILQDNFRDADREYFVSVNLDAQNKPISYSVISAGDVHSVHFPVQSVFKTAIMQNASSVILCHNHPGGTLKASNEDLDATRVIVSAGNILGIKVLDHFILTPYDYLSMRERYSEVFA